MKRNAFSHHDGLYLATAVPEQVDRLITTDPHLLGLSEAPVFTPGQYL